MPTHHNSDASLSEGFNAVGGVTAPYHHLDIMVLQVLKGGGVNDKYPVEWTVE